LTVDMPHMSGNMFVCLFVSMMLINVNMKVLFSHKSALCIRELCNKISIFNETTASLKKNTIISLRISPMWISATWNIHACTELSENKWVWWFYLLSIFLYRSSNTYSVYDYSFFFSTKLNFLDNISQKESERTTENKKKMMKKRIAFSSIYIQNRILNICSRMHQNS
jgi:hypothetical protein